MAASLFEKPRGQWWVRFTVPRAECVSANSRDRRASVKVGPRGIAASIAEEANGLLTAARLQGVRVRARDLLRQAAVNLRGRHQGATPKSACITCDEYSPGWLCTVKGSTLAHYAGCYRRHISPVFGSLPLDRISRRLIREWVSGLESKGLKDRTVGLYFRIFAAMLAQAVRDEELRVHPAPTMRSIRSTKLRTDRRRVRSLDTETLALVLRTVREREIDPNRSLMVEFMAATGVRIGEASGLYWTDVDTTRLQARVRRTASRGVVGPTKGRERRTVELAASLVAQLRRLRAYQKEVAMRRGKRPSRFMFQRPNGRPVRGQVVRYKVWRPALEQAGLIDKRTRMIDAGLVPHVLRHTWATERLQEGVPVPDVSEALGHSSPRITLEVYAHAVPKDNQDRLRVDIDAIISGPK